MAKKHGFRGTPVRPSPRPSSMAGIFDKRGDPLVSPREGLGPEFKRNLETENPDFDRYFAEQRAEEKTAERMFAGLANDLLKPSQIAKGNAFRSKVAKNNYDPQKILTSNTLKMRQEMRESQPQDLTKVIEDRAKGTIFCPYKCGFSSRDSRKISLHLRNEGRNADCRLSPEERDRKRRGEWK